MKLELSHSNIQEVFEAIELASEYGLRAEVMTSAIGIARENPEYEVLISALLEWNIRC